MHPGLHPPPQEVTLGQPCIWGAVSRAPAQRVRQPFPVNSLVPAVPWFAGHRFIFVSVYIPPPSRNGSVAA